MNYRFVITPTYEKKLQRFLKNHKNLTNAYHKTIQLLSVNPYHPSLRLHHLRGKLSQLYSVSINLQYRITLELLIENKQIILIDVGSHSKIY